jgi:hypothetical protein
MYFPPPSGIYRSNTCYFRQSVLEGHSLLSQARETEHSSELVLNLLREASCKKTACVLHPSLLVFLFPQKVYVE